jgi:hypothetical protein
VTDVFISYAHEDHAFVAPMARALEAEGFSVWWDHTIPPGRTWETFIARGITEARCCIVVWSGHSIASDWVKEEATLAKDGGKYLPVAISNEQPPMGFRRIQAARLSGWSGDRANAQWQLLVGEVRALVGGGAAMPAPRIPEPRPPSHPPPPPAANPGKGPNWALIGGIGAAAVFAVALFAFVLNGALRTQGDPSAPSMSATLIAPASLSLADVVGAWQVVGGTGCVDNPQRFVASGDRMRWDFQSGGVWQENEGANGPYQLSADAVYINGNRTLERRADGSFWIVFQGPGYRYNCQVARTDGNEPSVQAREAGGAGAPRPNVATNEDWIVGIWETTCSPWWRYQRFWREGNAIEHLAGPSLNEITYPSISIDGYDGAGTWNDGEMTLTRAGEALLIGGTSSNCIWRRVR